MTNLLDTVIAAVATGVIGVVGNAIRKYFKNKSFLLALVQLAEAAVNATEKSGAIEKLTGNEKIVKTVADVQEQLAKLGFKKADEELIKAQIEKAWANQVEQLHTAYDTQKQATDVQSQAEILAQSQAEVAQAQAQLANAIQGANAVLASQQPEQSDTEKTTD